MPDRPLSPGTRRCLGEPLPHQQADRTWAAPIPAGLRRDPHPLLPKESIWYYLQFPTAIPVYGVRSQVFLTLAPLNFYKIVRRLNHRRFVRLACLNHAASVHSEPGSNPSLDMFKQPEGCFLYRVKVCPNLNPLRRGVYVVVSLPKKLDTLA